MSAAILGAGDPVINNIKVKIFSIVTEFTSNVAGREQTDK